VSDGLDQLLLRYAVLARDDSNETEAVGDVSTQSKSSGVVSQVFEN